MHRITKAYIGAAVLAALLGGVSIGVALTAEFPALGG